MRNSTSSRTIFSWSIYDFANQPFTTLVVTFIYGTFFTQVIAENEISGTLLWSRGVTITGIMVAILSPIMGAFADKGGYRKLYLFFWTWVCVIGSLILYFPQEGQITFALTAFIISNVGFEMGSVFCNAFLPDIAPKEKIGRISGYGWSFGYVGGLLALALGLVFFIQPDIPVFGLDKSTYEHIRGTNVMAGLWLAVFSVPTFLFVEQKKGTAVEISPLIKQSIGQLKETFLHIQQYKEMVKFLIARLIYNDGLITIFAFGGIYAAGTFDFTFQEIMFFGIVLNVTAGLGAFMLGFLDDKIGGKKTILISNCGLIIACCLAVFTPNEDLFDISLPIYGNLVITGRMVFWTAGILIGIFSGPNQSASRSLMARFIPKDRENEFFGFFAFSGKATAFLGPFLLGYLTHAFGSQRFGIAVVLLFLLLGTYLLNSVDEEAGIEAGKTGMKQ